MVKVVLVCTSASELQGHPTGVWLEEAAAPYYIFLDQGYDVSFASPVGGAIPIDTNSMADYAFTEAAKKFMHDAAAINKFSHSEPLSKVDWSTVDAVFLCGGHGTCVDFVDNDNLKAAIEAVFANNKIVSGVCHGPNGFVNCNKPDGSPLVQGKVTTAFSDSEEDLTAYKTTVPFLLEAKLKELGALYEKSAAGEWASHVCVDGNFITGQNPASSEGCAQAVVKALSA